MSLRTRDPLPRAVRRVEPLWIPMSDGVRLAGRLWLPEGDPPPGGWPGVLEYIPYRWSDGTARRDAITHRWLAAHGYACLRVDLRGSGNSDGLLEDEYLESELADGEAVLRWMAEQPWCSGRVGMMGISWGGFNALQIAARRPPELGAVVAVCATDDRYADDVHYMGGCLLGDNLSWAATMFSFGTAPPDPEVVGPQWRALWLERLQRVEPWLDTWMRHPRRDDYWKHGSVCEDWEAIEVPVLAASGWADGYSNAVFRLMAGLRGPRMGLVGPWSHRYPHLGEPGPAIDFLEEVRQWWDRWLRGERNGVEDKPMLRVWMQDSERPFTRYRERRGRWVAEPAWPSAHVEERKYRLGRRHALVPEGEVVETDPKPLRIQSPLSVGLFAGKWCAYSYAPDLPGDQREEDGGSLFFETSPLDERVEILGAPRFEVEVESDRPAAMLAARLSDVAPDGAATRVTYGLLNLAHREGHEAPCPLEPGRRTRIALDLNHVAHAFPPGHRIRLSLSTSYFPLAWPPPEPVRLTVHADEGLLRLPVREDRGGSVHFDPPQGAADEATRTIEPGRHTWTVHRDLASERSELEVIHDEGRWCIDSPGGIEVRTRATEHYSYQADDFTSPRGETRWLRTFSRGDWQVETHTRTILTGDRSHFRVRAEIDAWERGTRVCSRNWDRTIRRELV